MRSRFICFILKSKRMRVVYSSFPCILKQSGFKTIVFKNTHVHRLHFEIQCITILIIGVHHLIRKIGIIALELYNNVFTYL